MGKLKKGNTTRDAAWVEAKKRYKLAARHVQMGREIGLNPKKLGKMANHRQEPWKMPLKDYIEFLYAKHFGDEKLQRLVSSGGR